MLEILRTVDEALTRGQRIALAMVVGRRGSLPMARRAKMLVLEDGGTLGTVGGGCLEAEVYAIARRVMQDAGGSVDTFHLTEIEEGLEGHVCGGTVTILTRGLGPDEGTRALFSRLRQRVEAGTPAVLAAPMGQTGGTGWALVGAEGVVAGAALPGPVLSAARRALERGTAERLTGDGDAAGYFLEPVEPPPTMVVFGAGHCGRAIGRVGALAGFRVRLHDDRPAFLQGDELTWADEVSEVSFESLPADTYGRCHYVVIVTRGHEHDLTVLRQLVAAPVSYLGMIGSRRKRALFERTLRQEGVSEEHLARLRSPMGLDIGADTPEEIAVAVVGEMIAARRGVDRDE